MEIQLAPSLSTGLIEIPECDPGGGYAPVQCSGTTLFCWCVTKANAPIEGTVVRANREIATTCASLRASENQRDGDKPVATTLVRLVNNLNPNDRTAGILEASVDGGIRWGPVCSPLGGSRTPSFAAEVVCRMMGFDTHDILSMGYFSKCDVTRAPRGADFVLDDVQCPDSTAASLDAGCTFRKATDCDNPDGVWVSCMSSTCTFHEHQNGAGFSLDPDSVWGAMCSSLDEAMACEAMHECTWQAGIRGSECMGVLIDAHATTHATVSHLGLVDSDGNEVPVGAGVRIAVGVLTAVADGITGFVCDDFFDSGMAAAIAACTDLGFDHGTHCNSVTLTHLMKAGAGVPNAHTLDFSLDNVRCGSGATSLNDCMSTTDEVSINVLRCNKPLTLAKHTLTATNLGRLELWRYGGRAPLLLDRDTGDLPGPRCACSTADEPTICHPIPPRG